MKEEKLLTSDEKIIIIYLSLIHIFFLPNMSANLPPNKAPGTDIAEAIKTKSPAWALLYPKFSVKKMAKKGYTKFPMLFMILAANIT